MSVTSGVAAGVLLLGLGLGGCSDESDAADPEVLGTEASSPTAEPTPAAQQEDDVAAVVPRFFTAVERAYKRVDADPLSRVATPDWAKHVIDGYRDGFVAKGNIMLGRARLVKDSAEVRVEGTTATVEACIDNTNTFVVPKGTKGVGVGATGGIRMVETLTLELSDGTWLVDGLTSEGKRC
ncbi:MAG TPA: hypothetical protein VGE43_07165 [Acidimicrobiales bacterium]